MRKGVLKCKNIQLFPDPGFFKYFVGRFSTKQIKCRYLHEKNENPSGNK